MTNDRPKSKSSLLKAVPGSLFVLSLVFTVPYILFTQQYEVTPGSSAKHEFRQQQGAGERQLSYPTTQPSEPNIATDTRTYHDETGPASSINQLSTGETYQYSIARLIDPPHHRLILNLESTSTQKNFRIKVACKRPPETNKFYMEIVSSAVGEFFGERSYPLAHGRVLNMKQLTPAKTFDSNAKRAVSRCTWNINGSSVIAGAVTPYFPGLRKFEECDDVLSDKYGVALQWLLDLLTGNADRKCRLNSFRNENTGFWQSLDNDRFTVNRPGFCAGQTFSQLGSPFFMPNKQLPTLKGGAYRQKFCDVANITMSILQKRLKLKEGQTSFAALEDYVMHRVTKDDFFAKFVPSYLSSDEQISKSAAGVKEIFERGLNAPRLPNECIPPIETLPSTIPSIIAHVFAKTISVRSVALVPKLRETIDQLCG